MKKGFLLILDEGLWMSSSDNGSWEWLPFAGCFYLLCLLDHDYEAYLAVGMLICDTIVKTCMHITFGNDCNKTNRT